MPALRKQCGLPHCTEPYHRPAAHCTALHCTVLHYTVLYCTTALHCTALHCTALHCTARLQCSAVYTAQHIMLHRTAPHHVAPHRIAPHRTAPQATLNYNALHCTEHTAPRAARRAVRLAAMCERDSRQHARPASCPAQRGTHHALHRGFHHTAPCEVAISARRWRARTCGKPTAAASQGAFREARLRFSLARALVSEDQWLQPSESSNKEVKPCHGRRHTLRARAIRSPSSAALLIPARPRAASPSQALSSQLQQRRTGPSASEAARAGFGRSAR